MPKVSKKFFAIKVGRKTGIFEDEWKNIQPHVVGFRGAVYKGFASYEDAKLWFEDGTKVIEIQSEKLPDLLVFTDGSKKPERSGFGVGVFYQNRWYADEHRLTHENLKKLVPMITPCSLGSLGSPSLEALGVLAAFQECRKTPKTFRLFLDNELVANYAKGLYKPKDDRTHFQIIIKTMTDHLEYLRSQKWNITVEWVKGHQDCTPLSPIEVRGNTFSDAVARGNFQEFQKYLRFPEILENKGVGEILGK